MLPLRESKRLDGFHTYPICKIVFVTGQCTVNINMLAPKMGSLLMCFKKQYDDFIENSFSKLDSTKAFYVDLIHK
jgi:hypothetical protein